MAVENALQVICEYNARSPMVQPYIGHGKNPFEIKILRKWYIEKET